MRLCFACVSTLLHRVLSYFLFSVCGRVGALCDCGFVVPSEMQRGGIRSFFRQCVPSHPSNATSAPFDPRPCCRPIAGCKAAAGTRHSSAPAQPSELALCLEHHPPASQLAAWCIPRRGSGSLPVGSMGPGEMRSRPADTLPTTWTVQPCSLSQAAPTQRRPRPDRRHQQRHIALTSPRRRRLTLSPPEVARHCQGEGRKAAWLVQRDGGAGP